MTSSLSQTVETTLPAAERVELPERVLRSPEATWDLALVQPDLVVVRSADLHLFHDRRIYGVPALIIEILSPSNPDQDLDIKRKTYARAGLPEYWIVRPAERDVLLCTNPADYCRLPPDHAGSIKRGASITDTTNPSGD